MTGTLASQILSLPRPGWSQQSLQTEQTDGTGASASLPPPLIPVELGQEAPIAETPNSFSQTSPLSSHCFNLCAVLGKQIWKWKQSLGSGKNKSSILHLGSRLPSATTGVVKGVCLNTSVFNSRNQSCILCVSLLWSEIPIHCLVVKCLSLLFNRYVWLFATPWIAACQAPLSFTISQSLLKFMSVESVMLSNHPILCCPLLLLSSIFPSIGIFSNESVLWIRWPKYRSSSFSISPSDEYSGLMSFRLDWFDLFAAQGTLKSLLRHHNSKAPIIWGSAFFMNQLSHPYMTTGKTTALTIQKFVSKVMSLLINVLSSLSRFSFHGASTF